ncbi:MAG: GFA family protein [Myxococcales bacterium]
MGETKTYKGSCHCGRVQYEVAMELGPVVTCNCSICSRTGSMLAFVPAAQFTLLSGEDALTDYQFGKKSIHHLFCATCGIRSFARGRDPGGNEMAAVNVRCLEGVDLDALQVHKYDGRSA